MGATTHKSAPLRIIVAVSLCLLLPLIAGVGARGDVNTREATVRRTVRAGVDRVEASLPLSPSTRALLARQGLSGLDPEASASALETESQAPPGSEPVVALALAELWQRVALRRLHSDPPSALLAYRNAAAASALAARDLGPGPLDTAARIHNQAVAGIIRLSHDPRVGSNVGWRELLAGLGVAVAASDAFVDPGLFSKVEVADDFRVRGMRHEYKGKGMGVAVVALRPNDRANPREPSEAYFPPKFRVSATVVAVPGGNLTDGTWRAAPLTLVFHDPFAARRIAIGRNVLPLAFDTSTPLAIQVSQPIISASTLAGLFVSDFQTGINPGLYMLRPYKPGKIPVVFIHGLSSNPAAFVQTINDLRNDPRISDRYQLLLFAYPTGRPIPTSAALLRKALHDMEAWFGQDPAFHQMVLVGHSMGGNLTRFMVTDSGLELWNAVFNVPFGQLRGSPQTIERVTELLVFKPVPFVRRVIFIAAPHRGSRIADEPFGRTISRFVQPPAEQVEIVSELKAANGPDVFKDDVFRNRSISSIGTLSVRSPILLAMDRLPIAPGVREHSIIFQFLGVASTDLVVPRWSSTLPGVETETTLPGTHFSVQSPGAVEEVRRLLLDLP